MSILEKIDKPADLKLVKRELLPQLAQEIRQKIIDTVSQNGGHFASSLGATELILAMHYVYDAPRDKFIWDTGHQAYAHKILTGRRDQFHTLRQWGGISGFPRRAESEYDVFGVGHASTSISAALGVAAARDVKKEDFKVVAVIQDGSMTGGMAFEALMNAGHIATDMLVILNDNQIFISHRVGALGAYLTRVLTFGMVKKLEKQVELFLRRARFWGRWMLRVAKRFRVLLFPGMIFEEMGFAYLGPINGHDINTLVEVLEQVKLLKGPVLLHVITKKGKGYEPAEKNPIAYHGVGKFNPETGAFISEPPGPPSYTKVFGQALVRLAKEDKNIVAITAAMPEGTGLDLFREEIPERFFDVGLAEEHAVTFAAGMATEGIIPVCAIYSTFLQRGFDQMVHDVGLQNLKVVFALDRGGLVGDDGGTHHGTMDFAFSRMIPGFTIMAPKDENELQHMLKTAVSLPGPSTIRYPRGHGIGVKPDRDFRILPVGKAEMLREGKDAYLLGIGNMVYPCLEAADKLKAAGISCGVVNARFVKPLDEELFRKLAEQTGLLVTVEEHSLPGGFGGAAVEALEGTHARIHRIGIPDRFIEHGKQSILRDHVGLTGERIAVDVKTLLTRAAVSVK